MQVKECSGIAPYAFEEYSKLHTKQLLQLRYTTYWEYECFECDHYVKCKKIQKENEQMIYDILATRPHIPNKKESKAIRKAQIKKSK